MALDVNVKIKLSEPTGKAGFGVPLILEEKATKALAYTKIKSLEALEALGVKSTEKLYKAVSLLFAQENRPKEIAVCRVTEAATAFLADASNVSKDWRQLIVVCESAGTAVGTIIPVVETLEGKMYYADVALDGTVSATLTDVCRTVLFFCEPTDTAPVPVAALVGETANRTVGSFTYKNLKLKGLVAQEVTETELDAIHEKGGFTYVTKAGDNVTSEGKTAGGEYIDVVDSKDYVILQLEYRTQKLLNQADKIPYDNNGIALLESVAVTVLTECFGMGIIATKEDGTADFSVDYALREETTEENRAARYYPYGNFTFALAGAIHTAEINGTITV